MAHVSRVLALDVPTDNMEEGWHLNPHKQSPMAGSWGGHPALLQAQ